MFKYLIIFLFSFAAFSGEIVFFYKDGCVHCQRAKVYLESLPDETTIKRHDIGKDKTALSHLRNEANKRSIKILAVPAFLINNEKLIIGFDKKLTPKQIYHALNKNETPTEHGYEQFIEYGLMPFTVILGLIDGFNPCAMWVLLMLLSILINMKDRTKMTIVAGNFIFISGFVYFIFMAAWLNFHILIGNARWIQTLLGFIAIFIGIIHIKDFFMFKQGFSLSIPEKFKPVFFKKVRQIINEQNIIFLIISTSSLAILVNFIELLCTAGIPAIFTKILSEQGLSLFEYYFHLMIYNFAYMLDDTIMVIIAVITMRKLKLDEKGGRVLKLISGIVISILGILLVMKPELLSFQ
jgi:glutaredoxin